MRGAQFVLIAAIGLGGCSFSLSDYLGNAPEHTAAQNVDHYQLGKKLLSTGQYDLAVNAFGDALRQNDRSINALNGIAIAYAKLGKKDLAMRYFQGALNVDANSAVTLSNIAYFHLQGGEVMHAAEYGRRAVAASDGKDGARPELSGKLLAAIRTNFEHEEQMAGVKDAAMPRVAETAPASHGVKAPVVSQMTAVTYRISNGVGVDGLAQKTAHLLKTHGVHVAILTNERPFDQRYSVIFYNPGLFNEAQRLAKILPIDPRLVEATRGSGQIELILGEDALAFENSARRPKGA